MPALTNIDFDECQMNSCCGATEISCIFIQEDGVKGYTAGVAELTEWLDTHGVDDAHANVWDPVKRKYIPGTIDMTYGRRICYTTIQDGQETSGDDDFYGDEESRLLASTRKAIWKKHGWELREFPGNHGPYDMWFLTYIPKHKINKEFLEKINKGAGSNNLGNDGNNAVSRGSRVSQAA